MSNTKAVLAKKSSGVKNLQDLGGEKVAYLKGTDSEKWLLSNASSLAITPIECDSVRNCTALVRNGEVKGYVHSGIILASTPLIDDEMEIAVKNVGPMNFICAGVKRGNTELGRFVDDQILTLSDSGFFKRAYGATLDPFFKGTVDKKYLLLDDLYISFRQ